MRLYRHTHYFVPDLYLLFNLLFIINFFCIFKKNLFYVHTSFSYFVYIKFSLCYLMNYFMPVEAQIKLCNYKSHRKKRPLFFS